MNLTSERLYFMKDTVQKLIGISVIILLLAFIVSINVWLAWTLSLQHISAWEVFGVISVTFIDWLLCVCMNACRNIY